MSKIVKTLNSFEKKGLLGGTSSTMEEKIQEAALLTDLKSDVKFYNWMFVVILVIIFLFMIFLGVLIWQNKTNQTLVLSLLGTESGGMLYAIITMRKMLKEMYAGQMILLFLPTLQNPEEKKQYVDLIKNWLQNK